MEEAVLSGRVPDEALTERLVANLALPRVPANDLANLPAEIRDAVPSELCVEHRLIPISLDGDKLGVAISDPFDTGALDEVAFFTETQVSRALATPSQIAWCLAHYYGVITPLGETLLERQAPAASPPGARGHDEARGRPQTGRRNRPPTPGERDERELEPRAGEIAVSGDAAESALVPDDLPAVVLDDSLELRAALERETGAVISEPAVDSYEEVIVLGTDRRRRRPQTEIGVPPPGEGAGRLADEAAAREDEIITEPGRFPPAAPAFDLPEANRPFADAPLGADEPRGAGGGSALGDLDDATDPGPTGPHLSANHGPDPDAAPDSAAPVGGEGPDEATQPAPAPDFRADSADVASSRAGSGSAASSPEESESGYEPAGGGAGGAAVTPRRRKGKGKNKAASPMPAQTRDLPSAPDSEAALPDEEQDFGPPGTTIPPPFLGAIPQSYDDLDSGAIPIPTDGDQDDSLAHERPPRAEMSEEPGAAAGMRPGGARRDRQPALERASRNLVTALRALEASCHRDDVIEALVAYLKEHFERASFFVIKARTLVLWNSRGIARDPDSPPALAEVPALADLVAGGSPLRGAMPDAPTEAFLASWLGAAPSDALALPIFVRGRAIGLVYADTAKIPIYDDHLPVLSAVATDAFERVLRARKRH